MDILKALLRLFLWNIPLGHLKPKTALCALLTYTPPTHSHWLLNLRNIVRNLLLCSWIHPENPRQITSSGIMPFIFAMHLTFPWMIFESISADADFTRGSSHDLVNSDRYIVQPDLCYLYWVQSPRKYISISPKQPYFHCSLSLVDKFSTWRQSWSVNHILMWAICSAFWSWIVPFGYRAEKGGSSMTRDDSLALKCMNI